MSFLRAENRCQVVRKRLGLEDDSPCRIPSRHQTFELDGDLSHQQLSVTTWNTLADVWLDDDYPRSIPSATERYHLLLRTLRRLASDVFFLQEIQSDTHKHLVHDLSQEYYVTELCDIRWTSGVSDALWHKRVRRNGNCFLLSRRLFRRGTQTKHAAICLDSGGNAAAPYVNIRVVSGDSKQPGAMLRFYNVHLDSDESSDKVRRAQVDFLMHHSETSRKCGYTVLMGGDLNDPSKTIIDAPFRRVSCPLLTYVGPPGPPASLDRFYVFNGRATFVPHSWISSERWTLESALREIGSDHLPSSVTLCWASERM